MADIAIAVETLQALVQRKVPARFGIVPLIKSEESLIQAKVVYHLWDTYGIGSALAYLGAVSRHDKSAWYEL